MTDGWMKMKEDDKGWCLDCGRTGRSTTDCRGASHELPTARTCAICGEWKNSNKGGIGGHAMHLQWLKESGVKMKAPESRYAHPVCIMRAQKRLTKGRTTCKCGHLESSHFTGRGKCDLCQCQECKPRYARPLRKIVDFYTDDKGVQWEELECGHRLIRKQDAFGYTSAISRRCRHCRVS